MASEAAPKAKARAKPKRGTVIGADGRELVPRVKKAVQPLRYYFVISGPTNLLGVWHAQWDTVASSLPGGKLCGSGARLFGFDSQVVATTEWFKHWDSEPV